MNFKLCCCIFISIAISLAYSKSIDGKQKKAKSGGVKAARDPKKRISTQQKAGAGHSKGPMANNIQSSVPLPVIMTFPMIPFDNRYPVVYPPNGKPKKGKGKKKDPKNETEDEHDKDVDDENDDGEDQYKEQKDLNNKGQGGPGPTTQSTINGQTDEETNNEGRNENENAEEESDSDKFTEETSEEQQEVDESSDSANSDKFKEMENGKEEVEQEQQENHESEEQEESEEDREENEHKSIAKDVDASEHETKSSRYGKNTKAKVKPKLKERVRRNAFKPIVGNPEDIMPYLFYDSDVETTTDGNNEHVIKTREVSEETDQNNKFDAEFEKEEDSERRIEEEADVPHAINVRDVDEEDEIPRVMRTRSLPDDAEDLQTAEKKFKEAETAAEALTQIQKALGANPINAVEESHSLADYLRKETEQYDEEIAKDIIATQGAQTRSKIAVNEDGSKRTLDFDTAKRKLESDRAKEEELRNELKELKDIEFMTTELELAKYLAIENARHQLQFAKAVNRAQVNQAAPAKPPQYIPAVVQQPAAYTFEPATQFAPVPQQPMAAPMAAPMASWQPVYPPVVTYAYGTSQAKENAPSTVLESTGRGRASSDLPNIRNQHPGSSYMWHEFSTPSLDYESRFRNFAPVSNSFHNKPQALATSPRPASVIHTEAQSRQIKKPFRVKIRPYKNSATKVISQKESARFAGVRKPSFTFPGPTYSPPPYATRNSRPGQRTRFRPYGYGYKMPMYAATPSPALQSFFNDQNKFHPMNNYYQYSELAAQQHMPLYTQKSMYGPPAYTQRPYAAPYRAPISYESVYGHNVERQPEHSYAYASYTSGKTSEPTGSQKEKTQIQQTSRLTKQAPPAAKPHHDTHTTQVRPTDYIGPQHGVIGQYALPRPQGPSFGAPAAVIYQVPSSYSESTPAAKGGIPSYTQAFYRPAAPYQYTYAMAAPQPFYPQSSRPFEVMNTDSNNFHGDQSLTQQASQPQQQPSMTNMNDPDKIPLGYGIFPVPEGAEEKMEGDSEEKELYQTIKTDKEKLTETSQAAQAVTKIENQVGFDPGSIAKLVDFVKAAAIKDADLSKKAVSRDQETIKRMEIAQKGDKKSEIEGGNVAMKEASEKLKVDQELLKESQDRLDKIKRMELIVTSIEAAKYSAMNRKQETLNNDVDKMNQLKTTKKTNIRKAIFGKRGTR